MRAIASACLAIGFAAFAGGAFAQYYPPGPYGYPPPPPGYRAAPMDDEDYAPPPPPGPGYRGAPGAYETQQLPPPGQAGPVPGAYERQAMPAPGMGEPPPYDAMPGRPGPRTYGAWEPMRPPGDIAGPQGGYSPVPAAPGGPVEAVPGRPVDMGSNAPYQNAPYRGPMQAAPGSNQTYASLGPDYQPEEGSPTELAPHLRRQLVDYPTAEPAGTLVIDTPNTYLYLVLGNGKAMRYGIGVGRDGFTWAGREKVSRMAEWPDWHPPKEMIERQPYLPRFMAGGESNPLGARALYLGNTVYRIHGTNQPSTIGTFVSSGCIRLTNEDVADLYRRVNVGTKVVVLPGKAPGSTQAPGQPLPNTAQLPPPSGQVIR